MGEVSKIAWTDATFNPWWGCTRVSPGCEHCYAETFAKRLGHSPEGARLPIWGVDAHRKPMSESYWRQPLKWNAGAERAGVRRRVFVASMADVFELPPERNAEARDLQGAARERLWRLIAETPSLDWLLLTKRPENVHRLAPWRCGHTPDSQPWPANVWLGTTVEDQERAESRIVWLLEAEAKVRFLSCEPLLGPLDLENVNPDFVKRIPKTEYTPTWVLDALRGHVKGPDEMLGAKIDWVIVGGESGPATVARPFRLSWARSVVSQCRGAGVAVFVKQLGSNPEQHVSESAFGSLSEVRARKGDDPSEWPRDLRVQEFPIGCADPTRDSTPENLRTKLVAVEADRDAWKARAEKAERELLASYDQRDGLADVITKVDAILGWSDGVTTVEEDANWLVYRAALRMRERLASEHRATQAEAQAAEMRDALNNLCGGCRASVRVRLIAECGDAGRAILAELEALRRLAEATREWWDSPAEPDEHCDVCDEEDREDCCHADLCDSLEALDALGADAGRTLLAELEALRELEQRARKRCDEAVPQWGTELREALAAVDAARKGE